MSLASHRFQPVVVDRLEGKRLMKSKLWSSPSEYLKKRDILPSFRAGTDAGAGIAVLVLGDLAFHTAGAFGLGRSSAEKGHHFREWV